MSSATVGRNDPCPCGSGKKFKACCIDKMPRGESLAPQGVESAFGKLMAYAERPRFESLLEQASEACIGRSLAHAAEDEAEEIFERIGDHGVSALWFAVDAVDDHGKSILERYLESSDSRELTAIEREFLTGLVPSHVGLYEVRRVDENGAIHLENAWTNERFVVVDPEVAGDLLPYEQLVTRVAALPGGELGFIDSPIALPITYRDDLLRRLHSLRRRFTANQEHEFRKAGGAVLHRGFVESLVEPEMPQLDEVPGEPFAPTRVILAVRDGLAVDRALESLSGDEGPLEVDEFVESLYVDVVVDPTGDDLVAARIQRYDGILLIEASSASRAASWAKAIGDAAPGECAITETIPFEDGDEPDLDEVDEADDDADSAGGEGSFAAAEHECGDPTCGHDHDDETLEMTDPEWLDTPRAEYFNRSPRQALTDPVLRPRVVARIKLLEQLVAVDPEANVSEFDVIRICTALGVDRDDLR
jgi:hypothetical protein